MVGISPHRLDSHKFCHTKTWQKLRIGQNLWRPQNLWQFHPANNIVDTTAMQVRRKTLHGCHGGARTAPVNCHAYE